MRACTFVPSCMQVPKQLTIRGVSDDLARRLARLGKERGESVNTVALDILQSAVGVSARRQRLARYATWSPEQLNEFDEALDMQRAIDDELGTEED